MPTPSRPPLDRALSWTEVQELVGLGRAMVNKLEREGRFPKRYRPGGRKVFWRENEIRRFMDTRRGADFDGIAPVICSDRSTATRGKRIARLPA